MDWRIKAAVQRGLSAVHGDSANYFLQRRVTKALPLSDKAFQGMVSLAKKHAKNCAIYGRKQLGECRFFEFGAGWDMVVPLTLSSLGVMSQTVIDLKPLAKPELIDDTATRLELPRTAGASQGLSAREVLAHFQVDYRAPCDARQTPFADREFDCITSTDVLEHVPEGDIPAVLKECHRILSDDGLMSVRIDYNDHYAYFDPKISYINFLRYTDRHWHIWNSSLHFQNRLRHSDYEAMITEAGFGIVREDVDAPRAQEVEASDHLELAPRFRSYEAEDLLLQNSFLVLKKVSAGAVGGPTGEG